MIGTLLNVAAIIIGSILGIRFGARLPERSHHTMIVGMGLFTACIGIQMFFKTQNSIIVLGSLVMGGLLGEWWRIEDGLRKFGVILETRFARGKNGETQDRNFLRGFLTASLLFCIGPIAILGSIQEGLTGDYKLLAVKSVMDGIASLAFASSMGIGVAFSALIILVYQGSLTLLAAQARAFITTPMINELTAVGGVLLLGIALSSILEIKPIRVGNMLPALAIAPLIVAILVALGIKY